MVSDPQWHQLERAAEMLKALADPNRLGILLRLSKRELSVGELAEIDRRKSQPCPPV
jgi:ArsR family transcriptional regulator